jgi:uncharacterized protein (TIGR02246 family)
MLSRRTFAALAIAICAAFPRTAFAQSAARRTPAFDTTAVLNGARQEIAAANQAWIAGFERRDVDAITAAYSDSAVFIAADGSALRGRAAILARYAGVLRTLPRVLAAAVQQSGITAVQPDRIYEWGRASLTLAPTTPHGPASSSGGAYLTVWQRERDGHWRITRNISLK